MYRLVINLFFLTSTALLAGCTSSGQPYSYSPRGSNPYVLIAQGGSNFRVWDSPTLSQAYIHETSSIVSAGKGFMSGISLGLIPTAASRDTHLSVLFQYFRVVNKTECVIKSATRRDPTLFLSDHTDGYLIKYECG